MGDPGNGMEGRRDAGQRREMAKPLAVEVVGSGAKEDSPAAKSTATEAWTTAALAHASILLTLILAFAGGIGAFVGLAVPLVIYLSHRERSRFVAFHALQALVYQGAGVLIYLVLVVVMALVVTIAWTISGLLSAVVVGLLLMPLALLLTLLMVILVLGAPLAWVAYGLYVAYQVYQGDNVHYWLIGDWVEKEVEV